MQGTWVRFLVQEDPSYHRATKSAHTYCASAVQKECYAGLSGVSRVRLCATLWAVSYPAPLSMEFSKQEYWSGLPFPSLGDLPHPGIKPRSPALQMDSLPSYSLYLVLFFHVTWHLLHYFSCLSYIFFIVHLLPLECKLHCVLNCWYVPRIWNTIQGIVGLP